MMQFRLYKRLDGADGPMNLDIELEIREGEFVTLYGPSGAGKTSTLRMLAGLLRPDQGLIRVRDRVWYDSQKNSMVRPQERNVGLLFQDYALFPHLSVRDNLEYALNSKADLPHLEDLLQSMELQNLQHRKPQSLSGGQQQRVALARCLVRKPGLLLLDEPLSALDPGIRFRLQDYIMKMHKRFGLTTLMVSHDLGEIHKLSDRVVELKDGQVIRQGPPANLFTGKDLSGTFTMAGEIVEISQGDKAVEVKVLIQNTVVKLTMDIGQLAGFQVGDRVVLGSRTFEPEIHKAH